MELNHISFAYQKDRPILKNIDYSLIEGKVTTIIGPNGSGKSTLLGIMARHLRQDQGEVILDGKSIHLYKGKEFAKKVAIVNQHNSAPNDLTVETLLGYGRLPYRSFFSSPDKEKEDEVIDWALKVTNIAHKRRHKIDQLSGGERQRVWIAMSLAQQTPILFLDEPTTFLDVYHQYEILELVKEINEEHDITIVMVLHDINQAIKYSDEVVVMKQGRIFAKGDPNEIITADLMREVYGIEVMVKEEQSLGLYTIPIGI